MTSHLLMEFGQQLALITGLSALLGVASFLLLRSRFGNGMNLILAVLWGALCGVLFSHGHEAFEHLESSSQAALFVGALCAGVVAYLIFSKIFKEHSHKHLLRASSILPHSLLDGALWGLSLGFSPSLSEPVLMFILLHRGLEVSSWMGLYRDLPYKKAAGLLLLMVAGFAITSWVTSQMTIGPEYRQTLMMGYLMSLGYLVLPMLKEVFARFRMLRGAFRMYWILCALFGLFLTARHSH